MAGIWRATRRIEVQILILYTKIKKKEEDTGPSSKHHMMTQPEEDDVGAPGPFGRVPIATLVLSLKTSVTPRLYFDEHSSELSDVSFG